MKYSVNIPITGYINVEIESDTEDKEEILDLAFNSEDLSLDNIVEWEVHEHVCEGNVLHAVLWNAEIEEI